MKKAILLGILLIGVILGYSASFFTGGEQDTITPAEAKAKTKQFVNNNLIPPQSDQEASIKNVEEKSGLYKVMVNVGGQEIESYLTRDGKTFFPQGMATEKNNDQQESGDTQASQKKATVDTKQETPSVKLFTMSYCPYGTQMEKALLPVQKKLGEKVDFDLQFVDYAMHGKKELDENLRQHCIEQEQPSKLMPYLECFLANKDAEKCTEQVGLNTSQIDSCVENTDEEYKVTEKYNDKSTYRGQYPVFDVNKEGNEKYDVSGSPTVVINGEKVQAPRNPDALLATICSGFEDKPEECSAQLSTQSPSPGFGTGQQQGGGSTSASCQ